MSEFKIPYEFVSGTKAKANEVNENFNAIKEELNKKLNINKNKTIDVEDGINSKNAINKSQLDNYKNELNDNIIKSTNNKEFKKSFLVELGNLDINNNVDLLDYENNTKLKFKVDDGTLYKPLQYTLACREVITRTSIPDLNVAGLSDGTYNLFIGKEGDCIPLSNTIFRQKSEPESLTETPFVQPTLSTNGTFGGNSFACSATYDNTNAYHAFDSTGWTAQTDNHAIFTIYSPTPLNISKLTWNTYSPISSNAGCTQISIYGSTNNTNWDTLIINFNGTYSDTSQNANITSDNFYHYYKIDAFNTEKGYTGFKNLSITGISREGYNLTNSVWLDTSIKPYKAKKYNGETWEDFNYVLLPQNITVENGAVTSVNNILSYGDNGYDNYVMLPDITNKTTISNGTTYKARVKGWIYKGIYAIKPLFVDEIFTADGENYIFYQMKGVK